MMTFEELGALIDKNRQDDMERRERWARQELERQTLHQMLQLHATLMGHQMMGLMCLAMNQNVTDEYFEQQCKRAVPP